MSVYPGNTLGRIIQSGLTFSTVSAGGVASVLLTKNFNYHQIFLNFGIDGSPATVAQMKSEIEYVRIKLNGIVVREFSPTELLISNGLRAHPEKAGILPIFFGNTMARVLATEDAHMLGTANLKSVALEVKIAASATNPTLTYDAVVSEMPTTTGTIMRSASYPIDVAGGTYKEVRMLPTSHGNLNALFLMSNKIERMEVRLNRELVFDGEISTLNYLLEDYGYVPQDGVVSFVPAFTRRDTVHSLPLRQSDEFIIKLWFSAAETQFNAHMETLQAWEGRTTIETNVTQG